MVGSPYQIYITQEMQLRLELRFTSKGICATVDWCKRLSPVEPFENLFFSYN